MMTDLCTHTLYSYCIGLYTRHDCRYSKDFPHEIHTCKDEECKIEWTGLPTNVVTALLEDETDA